MKKLIHHGPGYCSPGEYVERKACEEILKEVNAEKLHIDRTMSGANQEAYHLTPYGVTLELRHHVDGLFIALYGTEKTIKEAEGAVLTGIGEKLLTEGQVPPSKK